MISVLPLNNTSTPVDLGGNLPSSSPGDSIDKVVRGIWDQAFEVLYPSHADSVTT